MTDREQQVYAAICEYTSQKSHPPSVRELGAMVGRVVK